MSEHRIKDMQAGLGTTGRFGEIFIALGLVIGLLGGLFWFLSTTDSYESSVVTQQAANNDSFILGFLFFIEGVGFCAFGVLCLLMGWGRRHSGFEW